MSDGIRSLKQLDDLVRAQVVDWPKRRIRPDETGHVLRQLGAAGREPAVPALDLTGYPRGIRLERQSGHFLHTLPKLQYLGCGKLPLDQLVAVKNPGLIYPKPETLYALG